MIRQDPRTSNGQSIEIWKRADKESMCQIATVWQLAQMRLMGQKTRPLQF